MFQRVIYVRFQLDDCQGIATHCRGSLQRINNTYWQNTAFHNNEHTPRQLALTQLQFRTRCNAIQIACDVRSEIQFREFRNGKIA